MDEARRRQWQQERYMTTYQKHFISPALRQNNIFARMPMEQGLALPGAGASQTPRQMMAMTLPGAGSLSARGPGGGLAAAGGSMFPSNPGRVTPRGPMMPADATSKLQQRRKAVSLGVIRLDYDYPPAPGDIDCPETYNYDVFYRVVPGLTFELCQKGKMSPRVEAEFVEAIKFMEAKGVDGITGDCGFMMYFQKLARNYTKKPVFMSALAQLPAITCAYAAHELIAIFTANGDSLRPMRSLIKDECGVDPEEKRYIMVGCQDVPGFEAVALGEKVNVPEVTPGIVAKAKAVIAQNPTIRAILMECTELPPYSDAVRQATGLPVYDAITACDFFITGMKDNARFGIQDWRHKWDGVQDQYRFGANLDKEDRQALVNKDGLAWMNQ